MRLSDFVAILFSVIWRPISLAFSPEPMTNLRRPIWASTRARLLYPVSDCQVSLYPNKPKFDLKLFNVFSSKLYP